MHVETNSGDVNETKNVYVDTDEEGKPILTIEHTDGTKISAILKEESQDINFSNATITAIQTLLDRWGPRRVEISNRYIRDDRKQMAFLFDVIALASYTDRLPATCKNLLEVSESTILTHNRVIAQILYEYNNMGYFVTSKPTNFINGKNHDFNASIYRGEAKTSQVLGHLEKTETGKVRLTKQSSDSFQRKFIEDIVDAKEQVGSEGIIVLAPWSYKINALLVKYFQGKLSTCPPPLISGITVLVLSTDTAFKDLYIAFPTDRVQSIFETVFSDIQTFGVGRIVLTFQRQGLGIQIGTAAQKGSFIGLSTRIEVW